ncbi:hypothetical protein [Porphyromonas macacae]|nr:hypothetical protein [Porphyromonas macacae]
MIYSFYGLYYTIDPNFSLQFAKVINKAFCWYPNNQKWFEALQTGLT